MIIPELSLYVATSFKAKCKAQVVYRSVCEGQKGDISIQCGITILDMDFEQHCDLLAWLYQVKDEKSFLGTRVEPDDLWRFLFESGFIYPHKYAFLEKNKDSIKATYKKLYSEPSKIARHFIYQDNDRILGHMAMIRFYEKSWIIHHHAADRSESSNAGFDVLEQISRFINESHNIHSFNMNYVFCYFRPENKFPDRIFGGVARNTNDPQKCSLDNFLYFHHKKRESRTEHFEESWRLTEAQPEDLTELTIIYDDLSGGLMLDALELRPESEGVGTIVDEYRNLGFIREKHIFSLKKNNDLKAVILVNIADIGLNLSDITNSIHVFVTDVNDLTEHVLEETLSVLSQNFEQTDIPVLVFPDTYASLHGLNYEKIYCLWVMHLQHIDYYYRYLSRFFSKVSLLKAFQK